MTRKTKIFVAETLEAIRDSKKTRIGKQHYSVTISISELNGAIEELREK